MATSTSSVALQYAVIHICHGEPWRLGLKFNHLTIHLTSK
uniref:Uncharacterized protein n=1 Tax=Anguilla anguilla TaxID=7936 RepID=A0A0E9S2M0_ANGAN